ncbi:MAG: hypothetical protein EPO11_04050 [Gammaproteobacteria bacterium]|nr:MAG: hypothetical protein EPO11_04050 [Gammaproteobacteria bacterium]
MTNDNSICVLLAIWGERYIKDFLELSLPSLLAPGNVPALASHYPVRFVFLTRTRDVDVFSDHPAIQKLKTYCEVDYLSLDDLITIENYSTTLTLALDRAIRSTGKKMLKTYFLILMADYIMADGSLKGLMKYIQAGYSGICAGNFQVLKEETKEFFLSQVDQANHVMQISPRALLKYSLEHLHPVTVSSVYNQGVLHNYRANRFLYRHSSEVLVGRFYLLHALCIKPEVENYHVGSSFDYSFIPEMCSSGRIAVIDDSDDYFVVEVQPKKHELLNVDHGPYQEKKLARALSEWTTKQHRENAKKSIYFHARDILPKEKLAIEVQINHFIQGLDKQLKRYKEQPYYNHPYWRGAFKAFEMQKHLAQNNQDYFSITPATELFSLPRNLYYRFIGLPPKVFPWYYRWREYRLMMKEIKNQIVPEEINDAVVLYDHYHLEMISYYRLFKEIMKIPDHYYLDKVVNSKDKLKELNNKKYKTCIIVVSSEYLDGVKDFLSVIKKWLNFNGKIVILIFNEKNYIPSFIYNFTLECICKINSILNMQYKIDKLSSVNNNLTMLNAGIVYKINRLFGYNKKMRFLFYILLGLPGCILSLVLNLLPRFSKKGYGHCTNIIVSLIPDESIKQCEQGVF